jgi:hypothetical protein
LAEGPEQRRLAEVGQALPYLGLEDDDEPKTT